MSRPDRWEALGRWQAVADGRIDDHVKEWLSSIAREILAADQTKDANKRRIDIVRAVGLEGRRGTIEAYAAALLEREWPGDLTDPEQRKNLRAGQRLVLDLPPDVDPEITRGRIRNATAKPRKPKK